MLGQFFYGVDSLLCSQWNGVSMSALSILEEKKISNDSRSRWLNARVISWQQQQQPLCSWSYHICGYWMIFVHINKYKWKWNENNVWNPIASDFLNVNGHFIHKNSAKYLKSSPPPPLPRTIIIIIDLIVQTCVYVLFRLTRHTIYLRNVDVKSATTRTRRHFYSKKADCNLCNFMNFSKVIFVCEKRRQLFPCVSLCRICEVV